MDLQQTKQNNNFSINRSNTAINHFLTLASVSFGMLPHRAVTREFLATYFTLEFVFCQMFGAMLLHLFHRIETLRDTKYHLNPKCSYITVSLKF